MLYTSLTGAALIVATTLIHAFGTTSWMTFLVKHGTDETGEWAPRRAPAILVSSALVLVTLHVVEILVWAAVYRLLVPDQLASMESAAYFSFVTYTTLGYGDVTLGGSWRLLGGFEAINGILLAGWTTAMLFAIVQRTWQYHYKRNRPA